MNEDLIQDISESIEETNKDDKKIYSVYKHTSPSNKVYIGITKQSVKDRWANGYGYKHNKYFWRAIQKYGWENFTHEVLYNNVSKSEALKIEEDLIKFYDSTNPQNGYNISLGGSLGNLGLKHTEETKRIIGEKNKRNLENRGGFSEEWRNRQREIMSGEKNPFYGKHHSQENKDKMREIAKNRLTDEYRKKLSDAHKGKQSGKNNPMYGKHHSEKTKQKISNALQGNEPWMKGKRHTQKAKELIGKSRYKQVLQFNNLLEYVDEYHSPIIATGITGIGSSNISNCCRGCQSSAGGFIWIYYEDLFGGFRMDKINKIKELTNLCNQYRDAYYNGVALVPDDVYDRYFDELLQLERDCNFCLSNSPTQSVGYEVVSALPKVKHNIPLLSLAKTKSVEDVVKFMGNNEVLFMIKGDGLTTKLSYKSYDGITAELVEASTRGNGIEGSLITHNAKTFNIPLKVKYGKDFTVVGESVILKNDFEKINSILPDNDKYANSRNLASGSLSLLDSKECAKRHIHFMVFDVIEGMDEVNSLYDRFEIVQNLGFEVIHHQKTANIDAKETTAIINTMHEFANQKGIPCDGVVIRYDNYAYGLSLGKTSHHYNYGIAKKESDELVETIFRGIEWNTSRNGIVVPTGLFDSVNILDSQVSRATLHNLDYINKLKLKVGDRICCSKRNMVIPAIEANLDYNTENYIVPIIDTCPTCGHKLEIKNTGSANVLYCPNDVCEAKYFAKLLHFISKNCMDIQNFSEKTLSYLVDMGWVNDFQDIYHLADHRDEWIKYDGFGVKSVDKLLDAIENSRKVKLESFISALSIPGIGASAAKTISTYFNGDFYAFIKAFEDGFDWTTLQDFGAITAQNIDNYLAENKEKVVDLASEMEFIIEEKKAIKENSLNNLKFCITGSLTHYTNRDSLIQDIENHGGKYTNTINSKCNFLINNDINSLSSKNKKAKSLNIKIITEDEYIKMKEK